jgi:RNA polymerase sigma-70 factor, ECF subfamily
MAAAASAADLDATLVIRLGSGDREAVAELYDRYASRVLGLAYRILQDTSDAEDVVQEVFSQAWRTAPNYEPGRGTVAGWLLMIARTRAIDRLRARRSRGGPPSDLPLDEIPGVAAAVSDQLIADEQAARVRAAVTTLPVEQRLALELAYFEGLSQSEIAARLSQPLGTVKTRIRTALSTLRRSLRT